MDFTESDPDSVGFSYDLSEDRNILEKSRQALGLSRDSCLPGIHEMHSENSIRTDQYFQNIPHFYRR